MVDSFHHHSPNLMLFLDSYLQNYPPLGFVSIYMISCKDHSFYHTSKFVNPKLFKEKTFHNTKSITGIFVIRRNIKAF